MITIEADWLSAFFRLAVIGLELAGTLTILVGAGLATFLFARRARAGDRTEAYSAFRSALGELREIVQTGLARAQRQRPPAAGGSPVAGAPAAAPISHRSAERSSARWEHPLAQTENRRFLR